MPGRFRRRADDVQERGGQTRSLIHRVLIPGPLWALDRHLLTHHPVLWRSSVIHIAWLSIAASALLFAAGRLLPFELTSVPTTSDVATIVAVLQVLGGIALAYWAYGQYRLALEELPARHYVMMGAIYAGCVFCVMTTPLAFVVPVVHRIAALVPDREFEAEYALHEPYGFWCCDPDITEEALRLHAADLNRVLTRYGFQPAPRFHSWDYDIADERQCDTNSPCLGLKTARGTYAPRLLGDRLLSIQAAKQFDRREGVYFVRHGRPLRRHGLLAVALGTVMLGAVMPRSMLRRRFGREGGPRLVPAFHLPRPRALDDLDRSLRVNNPLLWSARIHTFLFNAVVYGGLAILSVLLVWWWLFEPVSLGKILESFSGNDVYYAGALMLPSVALAMAWGVRQSQTPLAAVTLGDTMKALLLYFLSALTLPGLLYGGLWWFELIERKGIEPAAVAWLMFAGCAYVVSTVFVRKYMTATDTAGAVAVSVGVFAGSLLLLTPKQESSLVTYAFIVAWFVVTVVVAGAATRQRPSRAVALLAATYVLLSPAALVVVPIALSTAELISQDVTTVALGSTAFGIPHYLVFGAPAIRILTRYRTAPKVT
jgi:hypothetical protein